MSPSNFRVRRATLDDFGALKALWESMHFPVADLEKRLTEFQIFESTDGKVVGAVGFQILGSHACIHSEAFSDFSVADEVRPLLWGRIQTLAMNHGVMRLWTRERAPYWTHNGFQPADDAALSKLPPGFDRTATNWLTLKLKDEEAIASLEKEFAVFMATEKQNTTARLEKARTVKTIVTIFAFLLAFTVFAAAGYIYFKRRTLGH